MESWITRQTTINLAQFDEAAGIHYPESRKIFTDPAEFHKRLISDWNYLDAVELVDWEKYLPENARVIDIGGGTGWLSGYMSRFEKIRNIRLIDSSRFFLEKMIPPMVKLMGGNPEKIALIEGLFSPLLLPEGGVDIALICSSMHHADNLTVLLANIKRVLRKGGYLFILNETPYSNAGYAAAVTRQFLIILRDILFRRFKAVSTAISSSGFLYDPYLNDKAYPLWYWEKAVSESGLELCEVVKTGLATLKQEKGIMLTHFICRKN